MTIRRFPDLPDVPRRGEALHEPVHWLGTQWAVTAYGIEARSGQYPIAKDRLWEDEPDWGWDQQMQEKTWVDIDDFRAAMAFAREKWAHLKPA